MKSASATLNSLVRFARRLHPAWYVCSGLLALVLLAVLVPYFLLRGSLPLVAGTLRVDTLSAPATIERDALGTPVIRARSRQDLAYATGFAHAQDRFFQMDLMRRSAAGELSALLGPTVLEADRKLRLHGFKDVAQRVLDASAPEHRGLLDAYAAGVNAGLHALRVRPWEYLLLRAEPKPWTAQDSILAGFSMYLSLHDPSGKEELAREHLRSHLPEELFAFLHPVGTEWDAPIAGGTWRTPAIPGPDVIDLRGRRSEQNGVTRDKTARAQFGSGTAFIGIDRFDVDQMPGSNAWAVAAEHTREGVSLLANDMHLGLRLPNVWYHARLIVDGDEERDLVGLTLPGLPALIAGSNGRVAWGFTNSYGDWVDLVIVERDANDPDRYVTPEGTEPFEHRRERIEINDGSSEELEILLTRWGPIVRGEPDGRLLALAWTAHRPEATNLQMLEFERARSVEELFDLANRAGGPVQNILAADATSIGWSLMGQLPIRKGYDSTVPSSWAAADTGWIGWRPASEYPRAVNPPGGKLWSANNRMIDAQLWFELVGEGRYDHGARASQIRDVLRTLPQASVEDLAQLQLDDRALFLARWRDLLLELSEGSAAGRDSSFEEALAHVREWSGRAAADDVGYRIVRAFRNQVRSDVFDMLTSAARANASDIEIIPSPQFEGPLWALVTERPHHLLTSEYDGWEALLRASLDAVLQKLIADCGQIASCTWGRENTLSMRHPLSAAIPFVSSWLDMPKVPLNGDSAMPRVQAPSFGASERLVIAPGHEERSVVQLPGGPVGHPLSPFYGAGHDEWVEGKARPLLPGQPEHVLRLEPR